jgi:GNAT superfamily N-acetyltransferase
MQLTGDIRRAWTDGGGKTVLTRSIKRILRPALKMGTLVFTECDLREPMPGRRRVPGIIVREATFEDVDLFESRNIFIERLQSGNRCFLGIEEATGKLTNFRWINTAEAYVPELNRHLILSAGEAYAYDLRTLPEFRRRGIDAFTRHYTYSYLRDTGYTKVYAYIHGDNYPSLRASRHFLKPVARIWFIQPRGCEPIMIRGWKRNLPELSRLPVRREANPKVQRQKSTGAA